MALFAAIKKFIKKYLLFVKGKKFRLIIIDDLLPVGLSPWRNYEYEALVKEYPESQIILDLSSFAALRGNKSFEEHTAELGLHYPEITKKFFKLKLFTSINSQLVYTLFLNNIRKYYGHLNRKKIPYAFTLYPGGGFKLNDELTDAELKEIIGNSLCKFVIVTQQVTHDYLINKIKISPDKVHLIYGVPLSLKKTEQDGVAGEKFYDGKKDCIDIVFMAHKYMNFGLDKGFHIFQNLVLEFYDDMNFNFHVIGNFKESDLLYPEYKSKIKFHGHLNESEFPEFFKDKDFIVSPNRPNVIGKGNFDGFPLGSSIAGGVNRCVMLLTNMLNESPGIFRNGIDYIQVEPNHKDIVAKIKDLIKDRQRLKSIAENGREKILQTYYSADQMKNRLAIFSKYL